MTYRLRNILLAVVLAVLAAFLTALYVASYQNRVDAGQEQVKVFVAKSDIPPGTPVEDLGNKVSQKEILSKNVTPAAVFDLASIKGQTTAQWIYSGEQVTARRFNSTGRSGIHGELKGNDRAMSINGNEHQMLAGIVKNGDHVDVLVNFKLDSNVNITRVLLRDVKVLRAPQGAGGVDSKVVASSSEGAYSAILQLTDSQAHKFFLASAGNEDHEWWLTLRAPADATDSPESVTTVPSAVRDGLPANQLGRAGQLGENGGN